MADQVPSTQLTSARDSDIHASGYSKVGYVVCKYKYIERGGDCRCSCCRASPCDVLRRLGI